MGVNGKDFQNNSPVYDVSRIGIDMQKKTNKPNCAPGDWAEIHYVGSLTDGRVVTDSRAEGNGRPVRFSIGRSDVFKCFDLGITQLHEGDKATLRCPSDLVWGGAYVQSPLGGDPIPYHSDVNFDVEVSTCHRVPDHFKYPDLSQPHTTTLQPGKCFYLVSKQAADTYTNRVLSVNEDGLLFAEHKVVDEPSQ
jgi:hypothetical protein